MKSILNLNKPIIIFLLFIFINVVSCSEHKHAFKGNFKGGIQVIQITGGNTTNRSLTLRTLGGGNADRFYVSRKDEIQWLLISNDTVKEIKRIYQKPNSINVFSIGPDPVGGSPNWKGTISYEAPHHSVEDYNIDWVDVNGNPHTYDPKIQVN